MAAYVAEERKGGEKTKTVRAFVSEFRGLTSTIKQKEITTKYSGVYLQDMVKDDDIDPAFVEKLLADMKAASKPPKPSQLGIIGERTLYTVDDKERRCGREKPQVSAHDGNRRKRHAVHHRNGLWCPGRKGRNGTNTAHRYELDTGARNPIPTLTGGTQEMRMTTTTR